MSQELTHGKTEECFGDRRENPGEESQQACGALQPGPLLTPLIFTPN